MSWSALFALTNAIAFSGWAALAFLPRRPVVLSFILYAGVAMLCLVYAAVYVALFGGIADPVRVPGSPEPNLLDYTVSGLRPFFMSDGGIVLGWTHYLAFDLFVGLWIARDADHKGFSRTVQFPFLVLTLMAGPVGLLGWLITRERRARKTAGA